MRVVIKSAVRRKVAPTLFYMALLKYPARKFPGLPARRR